MSRLPQLKRADMAAGRHLSSRSLLVTAAVWLVLHGVVWLLVYNFEPTIYPYAGDADSPLEYWDASHYNAIINEGYTGIRWAFYPVYPLIVKALAAATGLRARPEIVGTIFSTLVFAAFCLTQARLVASAGNRLRLLKPETIWGWLFFLFSPASWVFHSHHTESLFLLLSFAALFNSRSGRWKTAAALAGLCALTRNQGVFVALVVALDGALQQTGWQQRARVFSLSGLISFLLFACYPAYQYRQTGDALLFVHIQSQWGVVNSFSGYIGTLWYANSWQHSDWPGYLHEAFFFLLNATAVALIFKKEFPFALYVLISLWAPLYSGHFQNTYRYGAALFPALFLLGDGVSRLPRPVRWIVFSLFLILNLTYTRNYPLGHWAY